MIINGDVVSDETIDIIRNDAIKDITTDIQTELFLLNASDMSDVNMYNFVCKIKEIITVKGSGE